nr:acyl carrier protein 2, mitochondrial-like [Ipomoea batatas]
MAAAMRNALLKHLRVEVIALRNPSPNPRGPIFRLIGLSRHFCEEARGSFLDKSEVTDRVITVVKNFQKVDPAKVLLPTHFHFSLSSIFFLHFFCSQHLALSCVDNLTKVRNIVVERLWE